MPVGPLQMYLKTLNTKWDTNKYTHAGVQFNRRAAGTELGDRKLNYM